MALVCRSACKQDERREERTSRHAVGHVVHDVLKKKTAQIKPRSRIQIAGIRGRRDAPALELQLELPDPGHRVPDDVNRAWSSGCKLRQSAYDERSHANELGARRALGGMALRTGCVPWSKSSPGQDYSRSSIVSRCSSDSLWAYASPLACVCLTISRSRVFSRSSCSGDRIAVLSGDTSSDRSVSPTPPRDGVDKPPGASFCRLMPPVEEEGVRDPPVGPGDEGVLPPLHDDCTRLGLTSDVFARSLYLGRVGRWCGQKRMIKTRSRQQKIK